jgi:hypothetical protein
MLQQTTVRKKARQAINANDADDVKEEVNSDGEDNDHEEMVNSLTTNGAHMRHRF